MSNPSTVYANIFVDELIRSGLKHVCFVPGSRHTPLILAFAKHKDSIKIYSHLDERSASFFALGMALALDEPVAMVCTSGSAGANFFPAIIEAHQSRVPLIVLTADRPHELRQSGANQTIDQVKMFGDFVLWFYDAPLPEENPPDVALRNLRTLAARTLAKSNGIRKGVVHINMPFRKPLEPDVDNQFSEFALLERDLAFTKVDTANQYMRSGSYEISKSEILRILKEYERGLIVCAPRIEPYYELDSDRNELVDTTVLSILKLSHTLGYPIIADSLSHVRFNSISSYFMPIASYENLSSELLLSQFRPDVIIRLGQVPTSKVLNQFLTLADFKHSISVTCSGEWSDDSHLFTHQIHANVGFWCDELNFDFRSGNDLFKRDGKSMLSPFVQLDKETWQVIDHEIETGAYFDGGVVYDVVDLIPNESTLFAGNSLPVRHLDQFGKPTNKRIYAYSNRGASGIDGNISTALGAGAARPDKPLVAILGDITFYHDMNGLLAVHRCGVPITIVLLNNDGGGIFHRLPISQHDPDFTDYFVTAHGLDYSHSAKLYGLDYVRADTRDEFRQAFTESVTHRKSTIIEVHTNAQADLKRRNEIVAAVHARLRELDL
jgi:2-succinyl-5-enolpyruvyl-6-hydroxy-3-cyclohexene-1-carboxylate synthase